MAKGIGMAAGEGSTLTTVTQTARGISAEVQFAQTTYSSVFSKAGQAIYSRLAGTEIKTINDLVKAIKSGAVKVSDLPVEFVTKGDTQLIVNTRTAKALEKAGVPREEWNAVDKSKDTKAVDRVDQQLERNNLGPSGTMDTLPKEKRKSISDMVVRVLHKLPDGGIDAGNVELSIVPTSITAQIKDEDDDLVAELHFKHFAAYRFANESHARDFDKKAINNVVEIIDGDWSKSLNTPSVWPFVKRHFGVFFESAGYLEVLAEEVEMNLPK